MGTADGAGRGTAVCRRGCAQPPVRAGDAPVSGGRRRRAVSQPDRGGQRRYRRRAQPGRLDTGRLVRVSRAAAVLHDGGLRERLPDAAIQPRGARCVVCGRPRAGGRLSGADSPPLPRRAGGAAVAHRAPFPHARQFRPVARRQGRGGGLQPRAAAGNGTATAVAVLRSVRRGAVARVRGGGREPLLLPRRADCRAGQSRRGALGAGHGPGGAQLPSRGHEGGVRAADAIQSRVRGGRGRRGQRRSDPDGGAGDARLHRLPHRSAAFGAVAR